MAQVTQLGRNTDSISPRGRRSRNWCFTINNFDELDVKSIQDAGGSYVMQEETGETGTKHLQGLICFPNAIALSGCKKKNRKAHWEVCRNKMASINYCTKSTTRTGEIYSNFEYSKNGTTTHDTKCKNFDQVLKQGKNEFVNEMLKNDELNNNFWHEKNFLTFKFM